MIEIAIRNRAWTEALPNARALAGRAARASLSRLAPGKSLAILLTDDGAVSDLNRRFRSQAGSTNVLAFPAGRNDHGALGDIALAFGVCAREATDQDKPLSHHLQHLVVHGALHLIGYDHQSDDEAKTMETMERQLLSSLGIGDPYVDRDGRKNHVQPVR